MVRWLKHLSDAAQHLPLRTIKDTRVETVVDLHSNLGLGRIWVKSGTEIETGASFNLNLSANFEALSGESGLLFYRGLPGFDDGV